MGGRASHGEWAGFRGVGRFSGSGQVFGDWALGLFFALERLVTAWVIVWGVGLVVVWAVGLGITDAPMHGRVVKGQPFPMHGRWSRGSCG